MSFAKTYPFVQTHTFQMEPYLKNVQGYALFIAADEFTGNESVTVKAPENLLFPDTKTNERVLNQYSGKQWYFSDKDRVISATNGPLPEGKYFFEIAINSDPIETITLNYKNYFLPPVKDIEIQNNGRTITSVWNAPSTADTFWVFVFPSETKDILKDLTPMTSVMHRKNHVTFRCSDLKPGRYKIAIRANEFWEGGTFWGFKSESWAISAEEFTIP